MVNWSEINPVLVTLFTSLAVDQPPAPEPPWSAEWRDRRANAVHPHATLKQLLYLKVTSVVGIGQDETRYEFVPVTSSAPADLPYLGQLRATQCGWRRFTLQVQSHVVEHQDVQWCMQTLERLRTGLRRRSSLDALSAVGVSLVRIEQAVDVSRKFDGRVHSIGNMDVIFGAVVNDRDPAPAGWIERIELTSHFQDGGAELPVPPNVVARLIL
jgi:hypothetical protein